MAAPVADQAWLAWIGRLLEAPVCLNGERLPRSEFHCQLDDQPDHLVPATYLRPELWEGLTDRPLFLNPHGRFGRGPGSDPSSEESRAQDLGGIPFHGDLFWIEDPGHGGSSPFWVSPSIRSALENLRSSDNRKGDLENVLGHRNLRTLIMADVLVTEDYAMRRSAAWTHTVSRAGEPFRTRGFAPVGGLIHPFHLSALRRYYRWQVRNGRMRLGDTQSSLRYVAHNERVAAFFHRQLTRVMSALVGEPLKPSYVYIGSYQAGAQLKRHTDREQCEFSLTLCLDYSPEPQRETPWPIHLHTDHGTVTVFQRIGDALLYRGREIPHSRDALQEGHTSTSIFFHYVRKDFEGRLD